MKLKLNGWKSLRIKPSVTGSLIAVVVVGLTVYAIGNGVNERVVNRTALYDVPVLELTLNAVPASLGGLLVDELDANRQVIGVMVENSPDARPQSGLDDAEVVFEAIAEGGITRFATFFQVEAPRKIGPIRSVRPHYNDWAMSFDAAIAHVGGSNQGLREIRDFGIKDLDQFANGSYYYRDSARYAPHNVYSSLSSLRQLANKKGFTKSSFTGWRYDDFSPIETTEAESISAIISSNLYNISYQYDKDSNQYERSVGGTSHIDANTNKPITVDNVIIMEVNYSIIDGYYIYNLTGTGTAHIFRSGDYFKGQWSRTSRTKSFVFKSGGKILTLQSGQTWVSAIKPGNAVVVK